MTSVQSLFPANPLAAPCLLSPPSHTSPLLPRQQHPPACARHCLGSVVMRRGVHVCVFIWDTGGCNPAQVITSFVLLNHPSFAFPLPAPILSSFISHVSSSIFHLTFPHLFVLTFKVLSFFAAVLLSTVSHLMCTRCKLHKHIRMRTE